MRKYFLALLMIFSIAVLPFAGRAADDPSMHDIYEAANGGHLAQAQEMIGRVLTDHPGSAKAHYVAAELDARQGQLAGAREQLATAERLAPGLPFAKSDAVAALRAEIGGGGVSSVRQIQANAAPQGGSGMSLGVMAALAVGVGLLLMMLFRSRSRGPTAYAPGNPPQPAYGPGGGVMQGGGGIGSGIAGGLASGLAVGAGVVAGEALAHRLLDGGEREHFAERPVDDTMVDRDDTRGNANMGGNDFGVADSGSWDDSGSSIGDSGGGGSDDWG